MIILHIFQIVIFLILLINSVQLMPAFSRCLPAAGSAVQAGYLGAMLTVRLARNILGLILVTASTAPNPAVHLLVPKGIVLFLVLAFVSVVLTHYRQRVLFEGVRF